MTQIRITDAAGVTGVFINPVTIEPYTKPAPSTVFGVTPDYNNGQAGFDAHMKLFPKSGVARVYGQDCGQWDNANVKALVAAGNRCWFSWKNFTLPSLIANWNAMTVEADYTPFHEYNRPTGGPVLADYRTHITNVFKARDAHHNKALIKLGPIASWFPVANDKQGIHWESIMDFPWDFMGWDQYNPQNNVIANPDNLLLLPVSSGKTYGLPVQIGEWGIQPGSYTETAAAQFVTDYGAACVKNGITRAAYWCSQAGTNPNYHVDSRPPVLAAVKGLLGYK